jgi:ribosomal protein S18 acetylase RimI-like enzyme
MTELIVRAAQLSDRSHLRQAVIELQEHERRLHATRLPGEQIADAYLDWLLRRAEQGGLIAVAEANGEFAGFAAGAIEDDDTITETADSNRYGLVSDVCVLPAYRGSRIAAKLIAALEEHFRRAGVSRMRIGALAANQPARAAYEYAGFVAYEIIYEKLIATSGWCFQFES